MNCAATSHSLLIAWHSRTGASRAMASAAAEGARDEVCVHLCAAENVTSEMVLNSDAYLFVCPENLGSMSGAMKEFFDRCYYPVLGRIEGRGYGSIIAAGSDGDGALRQLDRIVTGWRLKRVAAPLIVNLGAQSPDAILAEKNVPELELLKCREMGAAIGAGMAMGIF